MAAGNAGGLVGQTLGEYRLTSLLGAGGMAEVYRGEDTRLGRVVAVKVLPAELADDPDYVRRFREEAERVGSLDHPNVVRVFSAGEERGLLYLVMPLLHESLRDRMKREGLLPLAEAARLVVQVAAALDAAHARGIVHRDVKPENILLNAQGRALLTDFGIARNEAFLRATIGDRTLAATGLPVGTPEYMAPEQLGNGAVDARADIYALGVVLYELLTGTLPFEANTPLDVAALVLAARFDPPAARNPLIWPELEAVVLRAMASDPNARYQDTRSFALALRDAVVSHRGGAAGARATARGATTDAPTMPLAAGREPARYDAPGTDATWTAPGPEWAIGARYLLPRSGRSVFMLAATLALLLVVVCAVSGFAIIHGLALPGSPVSGYRGPYSGGLTTVTPTDTYAIPTIPYAGPGVTPYPTDTPGGPPTATPFGTPPSSPPNVKFPSFGTSNQGGYCIGSQSISNFSSFAVGWDWSGGSVPSNLSYEIGGSGWSSGPPRGSLAAFESNLKLTVRFPCPRKTKYYSIQATAYQADNQSNSATFNFTMKAP